MAIDEFQKLLEEVESFGSMIIYEWNLFEGYSEEELIRDPLSPYCFHYLSELAKAVEICGQELTVEEFYNVGYPPDDFSLEKYGKVWYIHNPNDILEVLLDVY